MISTIRANNGSFANFGSVVLQPQPTSSVAHAITTQTSILATLASDVLPVRQVSLPVQVLSVSPAKITQLINPSLSAIVALMTTPAATKKVVTLRLPITNIVPTYGLTLDAGRTYDPRTTQGFVNTATKFQPYEQLTGIAQERPEVVMLTNVQPLFNASVSSTAPNFQDAMEAAGLSQFMTDAGKYVDAQFNMRTISVANVNQSINGLSSQYANINQQVAQRSADFTQALTVLQGNASFLLNLVRIIESQKSQLDLRNDLYIIDSQEMATYMVTNFSQQHLSISPTNAALALQLLVSAGSRATFTVTDVLADLGYATDSVTNVFASTKIWMQLLVELKTILQYHSQRFIDVTPTYQNNDTNPTTVLTPPVSYFSLSSNLPSLPSLNELVSLQAANASTTIGQLVPAFAAIYQNVTFKTEEARIAALAHLVSQEYRYSYALTRSAVIAALQNSFGYAVATQANTSVFDAIIGNFGNNITDFSSAENWTLAGLAQQQPQTSATSTGVLTFETKYVEGDTGTLTPGGDYFFDQILQTDGTSFNTKNLDQLTSALNTKLNQFAIIADGFNMMCIPAQPNQATPGVPIDSQDSFLNNGTDVAYALISQLINPSTGQALNTIINDPLAAIYDQARTDPTVKTILFLYTLSKVARAYGVNVPFLASSARGDNTPLVNYLIDTLVTQLENTIEKQNPSNVFQVNSSITIIQVSTNNVVSAMTAGTTLTSIVEQYMSEILAQFRQRTSAINAANYTVYSGVLDTIIAMAAFDFVISAVARYGNQSLVGVVHSSSGQPSFVISQNSTSHSVSFNELTQRLAGEANLTRELVMTITNVLRRLGGSLTGASNVFNSPTTQSSLQQIALAINNQQLLGMLLNEQQIMLLASTVASLTVASAPSATQAPSKNATNSSSDIAVLDESDVAPAMRAAVLGYFGQGDLASTEALNKRILTVGIPLGFTQRMKQKVSIQNQKRSTFENKRNDIVNVTIYKVDLQNSDIVYQPLRYMFEMARFPLRYGTSQWLPIPDQPTLADIINAIPTQCYSQSPDSSTATAISAGVEYASTAIAGSSGITGAIAAFDDPSYAFLTANEKAQILNNHTVSQLLETYIKLMTGIDVAEYNYDMVAPPAPVSSVFITTLVNQLVAQIVQNASASGTDTRTKNSLTIQQVGGILFSTTTAKAGGNIATATTRKKMLSNPSGVAGQVTAAALYRSANMPNPKVVTLEQQQAAGNVDTLLDALGTDDVELMMAHLQSISQFANMLTSLADTDALNSKVLTPKQFDRVFNVLVDPRDFQVDVAKTIATPFGQSALNLLLQSGDIVPSDIDSTSTAIQATAAYQLQATETILQGRAFPQGSTAPNINSYAFRERDKGQGDLIADKYFVTIETYGEDET
jgi:hypothetical protein